MMDDELLGRAVELKKRMGFLIRQQGALLHLIQHGCNDLSEAMQDGIELDKDVVADALSRQLMQTSAKLGVVQKEWEEL